MIRALVIGFNPSLTDRIRGLFIKYEETVHTPANPSDNCSYLCM